MVFSIYVVIWILDCCRNSVRRVHKGRRVCSGRQALFQFLKVAKARLKTALSSAGKNNPFVLHVVASARYIYRWRAGGFFLRAPRARALLARARMFVTSQVLFFPNQQYKI
jgi:hypothetical protein